VLGGYPPVPNQAATIDSTAELITALREQLGLKLEGTREPHDVLVVDSISRPTPD